VKGCPEKERRVRADKTGGIGKGSDPKRRSGESGRARRRCGGTGQEGKDRETEGKKEAELCSGREAGEAGGRSCMNHEQEVSWWNSSLSLKV
jgi:hypothetical protein